jgi:hypothetical protein
MTESVRTLTDIFIHEGYNDAWLVNDIALARVDIPFTIDSFTAAICLPDDITPVDATLPSTGDKCIAVGWGVMGKNGGPVADTLQQVEVPILPKCKEMYNNITFQVCGGYDEGGKDACQGMLIKFSEMTSIPIRSSPIKN